MKLESEKPHFMRSEDSERLLQSFGGNLKNVRSMHYKIVNAEAESLNLNITVYGEIPEDFDAETFLNQHVTIE